MARGLLKAFKSKKKKSTSEQKDSSKPTIGGHRATPPPPPGPTNPVPLPVIGGHRRKSGSSTERKDGSTSSAPTIGAHRTAPTPQGSNPVPLPVIGSHRAKAPTPTGTASIAEMQTWQSAKKTSDGSGERPSLIGRGRASKPVPTEDEKDSGPYNNSYGAYGSIPIPLDHDEDKDPGPYNNNYGAYGSIPIPLDHDEDKDPGPYNNYGGATTGGVTYRQPGDSFPDLEDDKDPGPYNNYGGATTYRQPGDSFPDLEDDKDPGPYNNYGGATTGGVTYRQPGDSFPDLEDDKDPGPYNNYGGATTGGVTYRRPGDSFPDLEDDKDPGPYNNYGAYGSIPLDDDVDSGDYNNVDYSEIDSDAGKRIRDDVKEHVDAQKSDTPSTGAKAVEPPKEEIPEVRKHRVWLIAQLGKEYAQERTTQRKDLVGAVHDVGADIAKYYAGVREFQNLASDDIQGMRRLLTSLGAETIADRFGTVDEARKYVEWWYGQLLEKARREELPIAEDGTVGDLSTRMVEYDDEAAQERSLVLVGNQKLYRNDEKKSPVDTKAGVTHFTGVGAEIFVVGLNNDIHMASHKIGKFHHSSLLGGKPVAMAGEIKATNGKIDWISNKSGHYKPSLTQLQQFLHHLSTDIPLDFPIQGMNVPAGTTARQVVEGVDTLGQKKEAFGRDHNKTQEMIYAWIAAIGKPAVKKVMHDMDWSMTYYDDEWEIEDENDDKVAPKLVRDALKKAYPNIKPVGNKS
ncbi:hypothetical protein GCM10009795_017560 [Nocardioides hankookensis]|uniref:Uncharacterized protein n=1 Tax=Nocardioides hankookensis TaxID=443157 RepID=A0ABW1LIY0_9ACTN